jgi:hypothetical protein
MMRRRRLGQEPVPEQGNRIRVMECRHELLKPPFSLNWLNRPI